MIHKMVERAKLLRAAFLLQTNWLSSYYLKNYDNIHDFRFFPITFFGYFTALKLEIQFSAQKKQGCLLWPMSRDEK